MSLEEQPELRCSGTVAGRLEEDRRDYSKELEESTDYYGSTISETKHKNSLILVKGPLFDFCSSTITIFISIAVVLNYLIISERVKLKDVPFATPRPETLYAHDHQKVFNFPNAELSSNFEGGNARLIRQNAPYEFEVKVGGEANGTTRRWFYFSIDNVRQPVTMSFYVSNLTLDRDVLHNGILPVYRSDSSNQVWTRLQQVTRVRQTDTNEMEIEFTYSYDPSSDGKVSFALAFPWAMKAQRTYMNSLIKAYGNHSTIFLEKHKFLIPKDERPRDLIMFSSRQNLDFKNRVAISGIQLPTIIANKSIILLVSRIHGFESLSSRAMSNALDYMLGSSKVAQDLREKHLIMALPLLNIDGAVLGLNLADGVGLNPDKDCEELPGHNVSTVSLLCKGMRDHILQLGTGRHVAAVIFFRSSLSATRVSVKVPYEGRNAFSRLLFPLRVAEQFKTQKLNSVIGTTNSSILSYIGKQYTKSIVAEVNIPNMKQEAKSHALVVDTDIETVVKSESASRGKSSINRVAERVILALHKTLTLSKDSPVSKVKPTNLAKISSNTSKSTSRSSFKSSNRPPSTETFHSVTKKAKQTLNEKIKSLHQHLTNSTTSRAN